MEKRQDEKKKISRPLPGPRIQTIRTRSPGAGDEGRLTLPCKDLRRRDNPSEGATDGADWPAANHVGDQAADYCSNNGRHHNDSDMALVEVLRLDSHLLTPFSFCYLLPRVKRVRSVDSSLVWRPSAWLVAYGRRPDNHRGWLSRRMFLAAGSRKKVVSD